MPKRATTFTVTGPGVDRNGFESGAVALSCAITLAQRTQPEATFYVRHPDGEIYGHVERTETYTIIHRRERP